MKQVSPSSFSEPMQGYSYAITYQMRETSRALEFLAEFTHFKPFSKLVIRHTGGPAPHDRVIEEIYDLSERNGGTFLTQTIHIEKSGINIFFRFLIWIIQRYGKPVGKPYLATLKEIIEKDGSL